MKKLFTLLTIMVMAVTSAWAVSEKVCKNTSTSTEYATVKDAIDALTTAGQTIQLTKDIDLTATIYVASTKNFTLDLNGHVLNQTHAAPTAGDANASVIFNEGTLTIIDSKPTATHTGDLSTIKGGVLTGGKGYYSPNGNFGGAIYNFGGTLKMTGGTIYNNTAAGACGAGIYTCQKAGATKDNCILKDVTIFGNTAQYGGGITQSSGTCTLEDCTIFGNSAKDGKYSCGGGIFNQDGTCNVKGGTITGNTADYSGAGIEIHKGTCTLTGVTVTGNASKDLAGGIYPAGQLTLDGCTVTNNTSVSDFPSGGVYCWEENGSTVTLKGKNIIKDNTTTYNGTKFAANLCLSGETAPQQVTLDNIAGSEIGVSTMVNDVVAAAKFTSNCTADDAKYFTSDDKANYHLAYNAAGYLEILKGATPDPEANSGKFTATTTFENADGTSKETIKASVSKDFVVKVTLPAKDVKMYANKVTATATMKGITGFGMKADETRTHSKTVTSDRAESIVLSDEIQHVYEFEGVKHFDVKVGDVDKFEYAVKFATEADGTKTITATPSDAALAHKAWSEITSRLDAKTLDSKATGCVMKAGSYVKNNNEMIKFTKDATFTGENLRQNLETLNLATCAYSIAEIKAVEFALAPESNLTIGQTSLTLKPEKAITVTVANDDKTAYVPGTFLTDMKKDLISLVNIASDSEMKKQLIKNVLGYMKTIDSAVSGKRNVTVTVSFDAATAISNVDASTSSAQADGKFIENGKVVIVKNGQRYNTAGQRLK